MSPETEAYIDYCKAKATKINTQRVPDHRALTVLAHNIGEAIVADTLKTLEAA